MARAALVLLTALIGSVATAQMGGGGGFPGGGEGGRHGGRGGPGGDEGRPGQRAEMRAPDPIKRDKFDKAVTAMFREADVNRDGVVTLDELQGIIASRRDALIRARFQHVDRDNNGSIDYAEFSAWQTEMGSVALSDEAALGGRAARVPAVIQPPLEKGDRGLARLIEPLGATVLLEADAKSDGRVTLDALLAYEHKKFDAADTNHDGEVSFDELRALHGEDSDGPGITPFGRRPG